MARTSPELLLSTSARESRPGGPDAGGSRSGGVVTRVAGLVEPSGRRVLRALLVPNEHTEQLCRSIKQSIKESGLLSEWNGERFVAVDVPPRADTSGLFALLQPEVDAARAFWEWADVRPFTTTRV
ncbi:DUF4265 domain-containing protein [Streptomyces sp. NPDC087440]|uniref:DUF4265 domain-containing protein n=1 Tax=Streptomyces sp. NPDC087440 TaxID=3365790 RepID=UPI0037FB75C4